MMRQLGGSFGIALITTLIHLRQGYHRSILLENVNQYNPDFVRGSIASLIILLQRDMLLLMQLRLPTKQLKALY